MRPTAAAEKGLLLIDADKAAVCCVYHPIPFLHLLVARQANTQAARGLRMHALNPSCNFLELLYAAAVSTELMSFRLHACMHMMMTTVQVIFCG
jgi:hypothetical protein